MIRDLQIDLTATQASMMNSRLRLEFTRLMRSMKKFMRVYPRTAAQDLPADLDVEFVTMDGKDNLEASLLSHLQMSPALVKMALPEGTKVLSAKVWTQIEALIGTEAAEVLAQYGASDVEALMLYRERELFLARTNPDRPV